MIFLYYYEAMPSFSSLPIKTVLLALFVAIPSHGWSKVALNPLFGAHMVLQRDKPVPIWGTADAGETVTVKFAGQTKTSTADADGRWHIELDPMAANCVFQTMTVSGTNNHLEIADCLVGDVWLCAGQSNMAFSLGKVRDSAQEIATATNPNLRLFNVHFTGAPCPLEKVSGGWAECTPDQAKRMSAIAYLFGRDLQNEMGIPIGILSVALGGSYAEVWTSTEAMQRNPRNKALLKAWEWLDGQMGVSKPARPGGVKAIYVDKDGQTVEFKTYAERFRNWKLACETARRKGEQIPPGFPAEFQWYSRPPLPDDPLLRPGMGFNGSIAPLVPLALKGVVWYQGESHRDPAEYGLSLTTLIEDWRSQFGQKDLPFLIVGLPNWGKQPTDGPVDGNWPGVREQQFKVGGQLPGVYVTVNTDTAIQDGGDLHPTNKQPVAERLAGLAMQKVYGAEKDASGPLFQKMTVTGKEIQLTFKPDGGGLMTKDLQIPGLSPEIPPSDVMGFAIAGDDKRWHWAMARMEEDHIVVWSPEVPNPVSVRYNWANYPVGNLFGKNALPAAPFRTDKWQP